MQKLGIHRTLGFSGLCKIVAVSRERTAGIDSLHVAAMETLAHEQRTKQRKSRTFASAVSAAELGAFAAPRIRSCA